MDNSDEIKINLEPLYIFFTENTTPNVFAKLLDELMYEYINLLIRFQLSDFYDKTIHQDTDQFIFFIKLLRDILPKCEK